MFHPNFMPDILVKDGIRVVETSPMRPIFHIAHISLFLIMLQSGCDKFEYSPYQTSLSDMPRELNRRNVERILSSGGQYSGDTVTIAYSGDPQRFYDQFHRLVEKVNTIPGIDFLILSGDIADFGLLQEYNWIYERLRHLNIPYICAIGNHDFTASNGLLYEKIFGEKNFSFQYKGYKFLVHDTNGREYNFNGSIPDLQWLGEQLEDTTASWFVGIAHVPPYDVDFDKNLEEPYKDLFASRSNFILSLYGHWHNTSDMFAYDDHVRYMTSNGVQQSEFVLLKLVRGAIIKELVSY